MAIIIHVTIHITLLHSIIHIIIFSNKQIVDRIQKLTIMFHQHATLFASEHIIDIYCLIGTARHNQFTSAGDTPDTGTVRMRSKCF